MSKKRKILVIDDDLAINEALQLMLEDAGYEVMTMLDSKNVSKILNQKPNVILLDIWMPGIDGREVYKTLKAERVTKHVPVIVISATREIKAISKALGADDFIVKPFEMEELLTKVAKYANLIK